MASRTYKKYMKKNTEKDYTLIKLVVASFFGMLLVFTFIIKSFTPNVDVSIGDYNQESQIENLEMLKTSVDNRLAMIQDEDQGRNFSELMRESQDVKNEEEKTELKNLSETIESKEEKNVSIDAVESTLDPVYKVFIGNYTSSEQAKVAKDIILETGSNLNPIVKCIGSNNYTLQVGIFKNKASAETLLYSIQQSNLPGRIIQEY